MLLPSWKEPAAGVRPDKAAIQRIEQRPNGHLQENTMNSIDRQSLANTFAVLLFLLLVYGLAGDMDCGSERRTEQAQQPIPSQLQCETNAEQRCPTAP